MGSQHQEFEDAVRLGAQHSVVDSCMSVVEEAEDFGMKATREIDDISHDFCDF